MVDNFKGAFATFPASQQGFNLQASWVRSQQAGLDPSKPMDPPTADGVDTESRLFRAAAPVLERVRNEIDGERLSVMLVGANAEMLTTINGCTQIDSVVARIGATPGALWREETTGTNALATPFVTREPLFVRGPEHYVEGLHSYSCYGRPIFSPLNGQLVGVLDIMSDAGAESALMRPFVDSAIADIQRNIKNSIGSRGQSVIRAFEEAAQHPAAMVVAVSRSMVLQSAAAARVLSSTDLAWLQQLAEGLHGSTRTEIELTSGHTAQLDMEMVGESDGVLVRVQSRQRPIIPRTAEPLRHWSRMRQWFDDFQNGTASGVIVGELGSGRSTALREAAGKQPHGAIDGRLDKIEVEDRLRALVSRPCHELITIDNLDQLSTLSQAFVEKLLTVGSPRILAATGISDTNSSRLLDLFEDRLDLPTLRAQRSELLTTLNELAGPGVRYRFTTQATRVLESYSWPGNYRELSIMLRSMARLRGALIDVADLPAELRMKSTTKSMSPWQQASRDAIIRAMESCHGNKAHAAEYLGISRSTLYHRIKEYGIIG
ncbi:helix-turn-helix domain-containing protein [Rhodococcus sp. H29-C3]|uniref:sigma-54-dependent Fis family transcriptional regulator n=1 Tax=Rhodococcus sp. H29-C3 TaxID=3046307 RepID=UPI0024BB884D|nr:helix-turn-helix domain-containing protein [Rhodococcus sp. H29-C3]MDJ0360014.1 helix-turn-helix domain-containing protein [Rhodococcus sp. H29-C3]